FLVEAEKLLQEGKSREAAELCTRGLVKYPEYYTAFALLIRALEAMGDTIQMKEVFDNAPNIIKLNIKNERLVHTPKENTPSPAANKESTTEIETKDIQSEDVNSDLVIKQDETEIDEQEELEEISPDLEKDFHQAIRNDELRPEVVSDLTKSEKEEQEEIDIKETLTLAKIYEQQDAFSEALIIYKQLQEITADKSKYADKILELQTLVDEEKK
ncbi:MAG: hypothetical protein RIF34_07935, partial [Candidatus Kapaibacterium sp.]